MEVPDYTASLDLLCPVLVRTKERREGWAGDNREDERWKKKRIRGNIVRRYAIKMPSV